MNIERMFLFQFVACVRKKFGNVEAAGRLQIRKKEHLAKTLLC